MIGRQLKLLTLMLLAFGLASPAYADSPKISFTFDVGLVKVSIRGVSQDDLHEERTKEMLMRVAQLAHYSLQQLKRQQGYPKCIKREKPKSGAAFWTAPCLKWED